MSGLGLVFSGGGGKGAYQIGVWKYLKEKGLDNFVSAVSGTSVGALNASLFATADFDGAFQLWSNIKQEQILTSKREIPKILLNAEFSTLPHKAIAGLKDMFQAGIFSRDGLVKILDENINLLGLQNTHIPCYSTCLRCLTNEIIRFDIRNYTINEMKKILLATSAIPVVFDSVEINRDLYYDGGTPPYGDNIPIQPIYDLGIKTIIVIHLNQSTIVDYSLQTKEGLHIGVGSFLWY